ncbi:MAG TPA: DUF222 domain-containing protein [Pseudolysinimonas sp.]|nr:DUF222 domain-containing protein [Pseudolysinimonas sp.]
MPPLTDPYAALGDVSVPFASPEVSALADQALMQAQRTLAEIRRRTDAEAARVAAEIAHRSRPDLGYEGLAQKLGARTPEILVQRLTETSAGEARSLVRVGRILETADAGAAPDPARRYAVDDAPWLRAVAAAIRGGRLSIERADVIRAGLGEVDEDSPAGLADALAEAAQTLLRESPGLTLERLASRARRLRADLDAAGVAEHERRLRERRYLHLIPQADGMTRISGLLDPESAALVTSAFDAATSPRRNGPRFVDPIEQARAEELDGDERTIEQIAVDAFVELIRIGGQADGTKVLGTRRPAVRVLVAAPDLADGMGHGTLEGQSEPVSIDTVRRHICDAGAVPIVFDSSGQGMDLGRTVRLHTTAQRAVIAARDGGCIFPRCDRPPAWCEVHHPDEWERDTGRTSVENGVLLCRHHHMLVHNEGWKVTHDRAAGGYAVVPPASVDAARRPVPAPSRSEALRRLQLRRAG